MPNTSSPCEIVHLRHGRAIGRGAGQLLILLLAFLLLASLSGMARATGDEYRLGPQDRIRLKVYEWRATLDKVVEWEALNDEFTVDANGMLSLPFAGQVAAAGLASGELAKVVAERLQAGMGLGRVPDTSVEIVQFRPFYIVGHVDKPGEYPYRPGLTVLKALSIAGGLQRLADQGLIRLGREAIAARGDLSVFSAQANNLLARKARLQAELDHSETINFPNELAKQESDPSVALVMQQEQLIFEARREAFSTQMRALNQLKDHFEKEIASLDGLLGTDDTQIKLVKKELETVANLVDRGLAVAPRQLSLERTLAQIEGDRLRTGTALLRARQEISKTDIAILELRNQRANEAAAELRKTQAELEEIRRKFDTADQLLYDSEVIAPQSLAQRARDRRAQPVYTIVRQDAGQTIELDASEATMVEPGDTIKVEMPSFREGSPFAGIWDDSTAPSTPIATQHPSSRTR